jgi:hypothetical protein
MSQSGVHSDFPVNAGVDDDAEAVKAVAAGGRDAA